jgi:hypothetical protein
MARSRIAWLKKMIADFQQFRSLLIDDVPFSSILTCVTALLLLVPLAQAAPTNSHIVETNQRLLTPDEGLLLGNGDLSASVYQTADRVIWRLGKSDVWDRRWDKSDDPKPIEIEEMRRGVDQEKWNAGYGQIITAQNPKTTSKRLKDISLDAPSYQKRAFPCPKPTGELCLKLPLDADLVNVRIAQRLVIEEGKHEITYSWPDGRNLNVESFIHPEHNVLVVQWQMKDCPAWFSLYRRADPTLEEYAAKLEAETGDKIYRGYYASPKNTPLPPPKARTGPGPATPVLIEQTFPSDPIFKKGFCYWLVPFVSQGTVEAVDMKPLREARIAIKPDAKTCEGWLVVGVPTASDPGGVMAESQTLSEEIAKDPAVAMQQWRDETVAAGRQFWGRASVSIDDPVIENLWYANLHIRRCCYRAGKIPPGLYLTPFVGDYSVWHGDYHWNFNFEAPFWGAYEANQIELGDAYFKAMEYALSMGRIIARKYYHCRGAFVQLSTYPIHATDDVYGTGPLARMAYMTGWAVHQYWWRYRFTMDKTWLKAQGYPAIKELALFCNDFLRKEADGLYHAYPSISEEKPWTGNPKDYYDQPQVMQHFRYCLHTAIRASRVLDADPELRAEWQERLDKMAPESGDYFGVKYDPTLTGLAGWCQEISPPQFGLGKPYKRQRTQNADGPSPVAGRFGAWWLAHPGSALTALRDGSWAPERDYPEYRKMAQRAHLNGMFFDRLSMGYQTWVLGEELAIMAPLQEMMLQSWDGILRVFPGWPRNVKASFRDLRAEGAFLVSAEWMDGEVKALQVKSEAGGTCRVYPPWDAGIKVTDHDGKVVPSKTEAEAIIGFETEKDETYTISSN